MIEQFRPLYDYGYDFDLILNDEACSYIPYDTVCHSLASMGREWVKKGLSEVSPSFKELFENNKFINTKKENDYYINILMFYINKHYYKISKVAFDRLVLEEADAIYDRCLNLEKELKNLNCEYWRAPLYKIEECRGFLNNAATVDAVEAVKNKIDYIFKIPLYIFKTVEGYYSSSASSAIKKTEQRNRDYFFCLLMMALCLFIDTKTEYDVRGYNGSIYNAMHILYIYVKGIKSSYIKKNPFEADFIFYHFNEWLNVDGGKFLNSD